MPQMWQLVPCTSGYDMSHMQHAWKGPHNALVAEQMQITAARYDILHKLLYSLQIKNFSLSEICNESRRIYFLYNGTVSFLCSCLP